MTEFCQQNDIKLLPFGTVAGGLLSEKYLGAPADKCASLWKAVAARSFASLQEINGRRPAHVQPVLSSLQCF